MCAIQHCGRDSRIILDVVFHLAAQTSTYDANRDPRADLENNVLPMLLMLQAFRERKLFPAVVCASTVTICGLPRGCRSMRITLTLRSQSTICINRWEKPI